MEMDPEVLTVDALTARLRSDEPPVLLDVTLEDCFARRHLKGVEAPVELEALAEFDAEGRLVATGNLTFDRTIWNVVYGSGSLFRDLAFHVVNDWITIRVKLVA